MRNGTHASPALAVFLAVLAALGAGCAASSAHEARASGTAASGDPAGHVPRDLWLEVMVRPGRGVDGRARIEERPARFVILPDGELYGATDRLPPEGVRPARVRRLAREQLSDVWNTLASAGFTNASAAESRGNVWLLAPAAGEILATIELHADGERFAFVRRYQPGDEREPAMRRVVRSIASVAWASDEALAESAELPNRYDAGADPYARFAPRPAKPADGGEK